MALFSTGQQASSMDQLLESIRIDRDWNDGAARTQLLEFLKLLARLTLMLWSRAVNYLHCCLLRDGGEQFCFKVVCECCDCTSYVVFMNTAIIWFVKKIGSDYGRWNI